MKEGKADLLLHPVRMRIVQAFIGGKKLTTRQMAEAMPDIPQATLYRQIVKLAEAGVLRPVEERKIRGAKEITYVLAEGGESISAEELANAGPDEHMRYFTTFLGNLLSEFGSYLGKEKINLREDGVGYRQASLYLSDEEFAELAQELAAVYAKALTKGPAPGRKRRTIATIILPGAEYSEH